MIFSGIHSDRGVRATIMGTMIFLRLVAKVHGAGCGWRAPVAMEGAAKCDKELLLYGNLTDCKVSKSRRLGSSIQRHRMITAAIVLWRVFELWAEQPLSINEIGAAIDRYRKASIIIGNTIAIITIPFAVIEVLLVIFLSLQQVGVGIFSKICIVGCVV